MEGTIKVEASGRTETVELAGSHPLAAGAEVLLFGPEKHHGGSGVKAQLARVAMIGDSAALGGRVMLRASFFAVSGGTLGDGTEESLSRVRYPGELHLDAQFEIVTPAGVLYAASPVHVRGQLKDIEPNGTRLSSDHLDSALLTSDGKTGARLTGVELAIGNALVGTQATVNA